ncbi:uncharacterized protein [Panulirus ornatus]|uniref:uncharacterized protein n=1 Tax=Panulirus ornatus TaxID=150431 RepID=UPI003A8B3BB8
MRMNSWANNNYKREAQAAGGERLAVGKKTSHHAHDVGVTPGVNRRRRSGQMKAVGEEVAHLWVFRVVHLTKVTLKSFIERQGIQVLDIHQVSHKESAHKSFLVTVNQSDAPTLLYRTFWPGLVSCKMWYERGNVRRATIFSRRSSRDPHATTHAKDGEAMVGERRNLTLDHSRKQVPLDLGHKETHTTLPHPDSTVHDNQTINERKDKDNNKSNVKTVRTEKVAPNKRSNVKENVRRVGDAKPGGRKNSTSEKRDKNATNKGNKLNNGKKKVTKNAGKRKDKRSGDKDRGIKRNADVSKGQDGGDVYQKKERLVVLEKDKENIGDNTVYQHNTVSQHRYNEGKRQTVGQGRSRENMSDRIKRDNVEVVKTGRQVDDKAVDKGKKRRHMTQKYDSSGGQHRTGQPVSQVPDLPALTHDDPSHYPATSEPAAMSSDKGVKQPSWVLSLSKLLILSSEEVVARLLSPEYDGLLSQDSITDDELFLGVKVLAHSVRSRSGPDHLRRLLRKIWQPHVISLVKTFSVTVEMQYPERAERYFWDLAKFLDLYIVYDMDIDGMPSLFTTCLSEVLALSYRSRVSDDLVKVYRGMQEWVCRPATDHEPARRVRR